MFCSNCGKEIANGTAFCPHCGEPAIGSAPAPEAQETVYIQEGPFNRAALAEFSSRVTPVLILSIISIAANAVVGGVAGLVVTIIAKVMHGKVQIPQLFQPTPDEIAQFESTKKKLNTCRLLSTIGMVVSILTIVFTILIGILYGVILAMEFM